MDTVCQIRIPQRTSAVERLGVDKTIEALRRRTLFSERLLVRQRGATLAELCALLYFLFLYSSTPLLYHLPASSSCPAFAIRFTISLGDLHQPLELSLPCRSGYRATFWNRSDSAQSPRTSNPGTIPRASTSLRNRCTRTPPSLPHSFAFPVP